MLFHLSFVEMRIVNLSFGLKKTRRKCSKTVLFVTVNA